MKPTTLNDFIGRLFEIGLVAQSQPVKCAKIGRCLSIDVGDTGPTFDFTISSENSLRHYVDIFNEGKYSLLLFDGSMIFIKYRLSGNNSNVNWHRYVFLPAIAHLDIFAGDGPADLPPPDEYVKMARKAMLRFEFSPDEAKDDHPISHLHVNESCCRLPVSSRLGVAEFMLFVVQNFYPIFFDRFRDKLPIALSFQDDLALADRGRFRLAVPHV